MVYDIMRIKVRVVDENGNLVKREVKRALSTYFSAPNIKSVPESLAIDEPEFQMEFDGNYIEVGASYEDEEFFSYKGDAKDIEIVVPARIINAILRKTR